MRFMGASSGSQRAWKEDAKLREDACRNTGNLLKGGYQGMACWWKETVKINNYVGGEMTESCVPLWGGDMGLGLWMGSKRQGSFMCLFLQGRNFLQHFFLQLVNFYLKLHTKYGVL